MREIHNQHKSKLRLKPLSGMVPTGVGIQGPSSGLEELGPGYVTPAGNSGPS